MTRIDATIKAKTERVLVETSNTVDLNELRAIGHAAEIDARPGAGRESVDDAETVQRGDASGGFSGCGGADSQFSATRGSSRRDELAQKVRRRQLDDVEARTLTQSFVRSEEEQFVFDKTTAEASTKLVQSQRRLVGSVKEIARIKHVVAEVVKD
jgi:hypothetical protein